MADGNAVEWGVGRKVPHDALHGESFGADVVECGFEGKGGDEERLGGQDMQIYRSVGKRTAQLATEDG
jgi:hypothetical protein